MDSGIVSRTLVEVTSEGCEDQLREHLLGVCIIIMSEIISI